jgi:hypothetical protein
MSLSLGLSIPSPGLIPSAPSYPQFRTQSAPADATCLYQIRLCAPVISSLELATYTFPLSPSALRVERSSLSSFSDTQAQGIQAPLSQGVTRVMDTYGLAPPIFTIEGTTGWDYHSADGYSLTGLESMQQLAAFLATYADLNQGLRVAGASSLFTLEFYDYFQQSFWVIEPIGPQVFSQDASRPLIVYYRFRWAATIPAGGVVQVIDEVEDTLGAVSSLASTSLGQSLSSTLGAYSPIGGTGAAGSLAPGTIIAPAGSPLAAQLMDPSIGTFSSGGYTFGPIIK